MQAWSLFATAPRLVTNFLQMADSTEKPAGAKAPSGHFEADVGEDVIREALESVQRHSAPAPEAAAPGIEIEVGAEGADVDDDAQPPVEAEVRSAEDLERELEELKATLELSTELAKETHGRLKDTHERQLRAVADLDNYKKRAARERDEAEKFALAKLLKELLPVLDNLDRALEHAATAAGPAEGALSTGVLATRKLFEAILGKFGVKGFSAEGQPFDPNRHEAMQQIPTSEIPPGTVAKEIVRGYLLNDRLLRPALVGVAVAPPTTEAPGGNGVAPNAAKQSEGGSE